MPEFSFKTKHGSPVPLKADGQMHKYLMPFKVKKENGKEEEEVSAEIQATEMMQDFEAILNKNPNAKIAITYSANSNEAQKIIAGYKSGDPFEGGGGRNQGAVFTKLAEKIKKKQLQNQIHILPVATSETGGDSAIVNKDVVKRDMENIAKHLGAGWTVLGLRNQNTAENTPCAIGGGTTKAWKVDGAGKEQKKICDAALTKMIDTKIADLTDLADEHYYLKQAFDKGKANPNDLICEKPPAPAKFKVVPDQGAAANSPLDHISKELINAEQLKYWQEEGTKTIDPNKYQVTSVIPTKQNDNTIATIASKSNSTTTIAVIKRDAIEYPYIKQTDDPDFDLKYDLFLKFLNQYNNKTLYPNKVTITINNFSPEDLGNILKKLSENKDRSAYTANVTLKLPTTCQYTDKKDNINKHYSQEQQQQITQLLTTIPAAAESAIPTLTPIKPK